MEKSTNAAKKNRFHYMETFFFPDDCGSITPNHCSGRQLKHTFKTKKSSLLSNLRDGRFKREKSNSYHHITEIIQREHGLCGDGQRSMRNGNSNGFEKRFCGSRHVVNKLELFSSINPGSGSNQERALSFNRVGNLLCCPTPIFTTHEVQVWDWGLNKLKFLYNPGCDIVRISDLKFLETNGCMNIVSISMHGELVLAIIPPSGGEVRSRLLYRRSYSAYKLALCPQNPFVILSSDTEGLITMCDIRTKSGAVCLKTVEGNQLYSIAHHPLNSELCVSCEDNYVRVFDLRNMSTAVHKMCPQRIVERNKDCLTCTAVYNSTGSEILGSYALEDNYLFDNKVYCPGSYARRYSGHYSKNSRTKMSFSNNAKFFGPNSEFVIGSTEYGSICFWDRKTGKIINIIGDGVHDDYYEPHPSMPIIASWAAYGGIIKIWSPLNESKRKPTIPGASYSYTGKSLTSCLFG